MVHLQPLPGTPFYDAGSFEAIVERAVRSARALEEGGADGCLVQTVDRVYPASDESDPARTAAMALVVSAVAHAVGDSFEVGVQLMSNATSASLAVAKVAGGSFVRIGALVGSTLSPQGLVTANPSAVAAYRAKIGAREVRVIADVDSMHFRWWGQPRPTGHVARDARNAGADAVAVSHPEPARALEMIASVRTSAPDMPVVLAGNTNHDNAAQMLSAADGAFVGTCLETGGWGGEIDVDRVRGYIETVRATEA